MKPIRFTQWLTELAHLSEVFDRKGADFVTQLISKKVVVSIKVDSAAFVVMNDKGTLRFYGRNGVQEIDKIKRAALDFYEKAIEHIESTNWKALPSGVKFFMEMFDSRLNPIIKYASHPKNDLILLFAKVGESLLRPDDPLLFKAAAALQVAAPPIIFSGRLDADQKEQIFDFISADIETRKRVFGGKSFQYMVLSMFTTPAEFGYLIKSGLEGIVLYFGDDANPVSFKIVDPKFTEKINDKTDLAVDYTQKLFDIIWPQAQKYAEDILNTGQYKFKTMDERDDRFIKFIADLTERVVSRQGAQLLNTLSEYEDYVLKYRFSGLSLKFVPSSILAMSKKYFFVDDIFRTFLFALRQSKNRLNPARGITASVKNTINNIVDMLSAKGMIEK